MNHRGAVLISVLVITALAAMLAAGLLFRARAEITASVASTAQEQARLAAMAGLDRVVALLESGADAATLLDNPDLFQDQLVWDDGTNRWYFTIYAPSDSETETVRYGLMDEAGKINLNTASSETIQKLIGNITTLQQGQIEDVTEAILAYRGGNTGTLTTVEELLLADGLTGSIMYGEDANMNGILDPNENDREDSFPSDNGDGALDPGMMGLSTVLSYDWDVDADGAARTNLNGDVSSLEVDGLPTETIEFIQAYRNDGNTFTDPSQLLEMEYTTSGGSSSSSSSSSRWRRGSSSSGSSQTSSQTLQSGVGAEQLALVLEKFTVKTADSSQPATLIGLVNVNTASKAVLASVPGIDDDLAAEIVSKRSSMNAADATTIAWLYSEQLVDAATFKQIAPYLTACSRQWRVRCVGFGVPCGRYKVMEAVIDAAGDAPRVIYMRDLTRLGMPFSLDVDALEAAYK